MSTARLKYTLVLLVTWFFATTFLIFGVTIALIMSLENPSSSFLARSNRNINLVPLAEAEQPVVLGAMTVQIEANDSRATTIDKTFEKYNCPLAGNGEIFVKHADANNIPYWLVAAIAFQETSCGKNQPTVNGENSNNFWGYGVWGPHVKMFDDIEHGISAVSKYMDQRFYSQGITDLCEIMKVYTPPSDGSWCAGVGFFRDEIVEYTSAKVI